jgi:cell wall-associated NlpC family hydrolase
LKKVAILGAVVVLLGCSSATVADDHKTSTVTKIETQQKVDGLSPIIKTVRYNTMLEQQAEDALQKQIAKAEHERALLNNQKAIKEKLNKLSSYVGKTWYVFSGSSPSGWDCSGMTRWFYQGLGIEIEHSASKQGKNAGYHVDTPKPGDIVAFSHMNSEKYYHVGIYIGNNKIIHAGFRPGTKTEKISLDSPAFKDSEISFVRVIEN